jgi:hypothetical protein
MVGELGGFHTGSHHHGSGSGSGSTSTSPSSPRVDPVDVPKNYYELYMRLEDMPSFEEYLLKFWLPTLFRYLTDPISIQIRVTPTIRDSSERPYTMRELYDCVQYCPRVLSRL